MRSELSHDIILPEKSGFVCCPFDHRKLLRRTPETEATALAVQCPRCKRELLITIRRGQRPSAQSPD